MRSDSLIIFLLLLIVTGAGIAAAEAGVEEIRSPAIMAAEVSPALDEKRLYIVQFSEPPATAMHRSRAGRHRGAKLDGAQSERFDPEAEHVRRYVSRLQARQNEMLLEMNLWNDRVYSYGYTFNGVAVRMTPDEAGRLRLRRGVAQVWEDVRRTVATNSSPAFLGLLDAQGGLRSDLRLTGEDVIIGIIDTGITPGHSSFSDRTQSRKLPRLCRASWMEGTLLELWLCRRFKKPGEIFYTAPPAKWRGICEAGPGFNASDCNNKLIGARFYRKGFDETYGDPDPNDFASPADADGHGTHVASIAAGNAVEASVFGKSVGRVSGMAPRARVAVYKACWLEPGASRASCSIADLQKAIEDAVADGVDIINYSIGDMNASLDDPDDLELLAAVEAGVVSVVSAGNKDAAKSGYTIDSPATTPWVISVGATSRAGKRVAQAIRVSQPESLANLYESKEAGITPPLAIRGPLTAKLILAQDGSTLVPGEEDTSGSLFDACTALENTAEMRGNIALVQRGYCNFDQKIAIAERAGAIAVVVFSNDMELLVMTGNASLVNIPAVMIDQANGQLFRDTLLAGASIEITLNRSLFITFEDDGNVMGTFSGRGPSFGDSDFLKPDLVAPGTAILGGQTPDVANGFRGESFQYLSGTSQSAPHVAGIAALIKQAHPDWGPAEIKSALMTTSRQNIRKENNLGPANPFDMGAGHIVPNKAVDPGLLYPIDTQEYDEYLCTIGVERLPPDLCGPLALSGYSYVARNINLPSVAITELAGNVEVKRRVTNAGPPAQFNLETNVPDGISLEVLPQSLSLGTGESAEFTLKFGSDGTGLDQWFYGNFSWVSDTHRVYSPFVVQPTLFSEPEYSFGQTDSGSLTIPVGFGYGGAYTANVNGLFLPCVLPTAVQPYNSCVNSGAASVASDPSFDKVYVYEDEPPAWVTRFTINTAATDNELLRVALFSADELTDGDADLDLYVYYCEELIAGAPCVVFDQEPYASATPDTADELIDVLKPLSGKWVIDVHGYSTPDNNPADFRLYVWAFGGDMAAGNLALTNVPALAEPGVSTDMTASWSNLAQGLWLGGITHYGENGAPLGTTIIEVDSNAFPD